MYHSNLLPSNTDSEYAVRVRLTQNNSILAKQKPNQNSNHINCTKFDSTLAPRVHLTQNQLALAQEFHTSKSNTLNHIISDCGFDPRVRFTHNRLTPAGHIFSYLSSHIFRINQKPYLQLTLVITKLNPNSRRIIQIP